MKPLQKLRVEENTKLQPFVRWLLLNEGTCQNLLLVSERWVLQFVRGDSHLDSRHYGWLKARPLNPKTIDIVLAFFVRFRIHIVQHVWSPSRVIELQLQLYFNSNSNFWFFGTRPFPLLSHNRHNFPVGLPQIRNLIEENPTKIYFPLFFPRSCRCRFCFTLFAQDHRLYQEMYKNVFFLYWRTKELGIDWHIFPCH